MAWTSGHTALVTLSTSPPATPGYSLPKSGPSKNGAAEPDLRRPLSGASTLLRIDTGTPPIINSNALGKTVAPSRGTVVLLTHVEDERAIYGDSLTAHGFTVLLADDQEQAYELTVRERADVVITRIVQPGQPQTGLELLRRVKQVPGRRRVAVLIITSVMQHDVRAEAIKAGCDGYLLLPALPDRVVAEVARLTGIRREDKESSPSATVSDAPRQEPVAVHRPRRHAFHW